MKPSTFITLLALFVAATYAQQLPIPRTSTGYRKGNPAAPILLEAFYDFQCPDSGADWPIIKQVLDHYGPDKVYFIMYIYPLWQHRQAFDAAKAVQVINSRAHANLWPAIDYFFLNQESFFNEVFSNKTGLELIDLFNGYAQKFGVNQDDFASDFPSDPIYESTKVHVRLAVSRQIYGTASYYLNGFKQETFDTTYDAWVNCINTLTLQRNTKLP